MRAIAPIIVVGAGPVGLTTALGLDFYGLPFALFEEDAELSLDTKAGTILTRTLEAFRRYGVADAVLAKALRVDEIGDIEHQQAPSSSRADPAHGHRGAPARCAQPAAPVDLVSADGARRRRPFRHAGRRARGRRFLSARL